MNFIKKTFGYISRNILRLILMAIVPAVVLGFFARPSNFIVFLTKYKPADIVTYGDMLELVRPVNNMIWMLVIVPVCFICIGLMYGLLEHHMRMGRFGGRNIFYRLNYGLGAIAVPFLVMLVIYIAWIYLTISVLYLSHYIFYVQIGSSAAAIALAAVISVGMQWLLLFFVSLVLIWPPVLQISGYGFADSWYYQLKMLSGNQLKFQFALLIPIVINAVIVIIFELFVAPRFMVYIYMLCFLFLLIYLVSLSMTAYFEITGTERKDIKKKYYQRP